MINIIDTVWCHWFWKCEFLTDSRHFINISLYIYNVGQSRASSSNCILQCDWKHNAFIVFTVIRFLTAWPVYSQEIHTKQCWVKSQRICQGAYGRHKEFFCSFHSQRHSCQHFVLQIAWRRTRHYEIWPYVFSAECTIEMAWGLMSLKHYGTMAIWHYGNMV